MVGRGGFSSAIVRPPLLRALPPVLEIFAQRDLSQPLPRARWNGRAPESRALAPQPALLPEGLAPAKYAPALPEFEAAVRAFREGRFREAVAGFEAVAARDDGWLMPAEARLKPTGTRRSGVVTFPS